VSAVAAEARRAGRPAEFTNKVWSHNCNDPSMWKEDSNRDRSPAPK
jgi:hypothetical protein